jgi:hypothetical protein
MPRPGIRPAPGGWVPVVIIGGLIIADKLDIKFDLGILGGGTSLDDLEICLRLYVRCDDERWHLREADCEFCFRNCMAQGGSWPFNRCRPKSSDVLELGITFMQMCGL